LAIKDPNLLFYASLKDLEVIHHRNPILAPKVNEDAENTFQCEKKYGKFHCQNGPPFFSDQAYYTR
jgi:hypothetical protein